MTGSSGAFDPRDVVTRKRDGLELRPEELRAFVLAYGRGEIADHVVAAFLMAVYLRGLSPTETAVMTSAMIASGSTLPLSGVTRPKVDKHSTGGVSDGVTLVFAPLAASLGLAVAKLSGRGLGHTGGTLDKLEAIPRFNARLSRKEFERAIAGAACVISTSTEGIAPADKKIYALRDVTGTVESLPLITASIMSKKLAMGASALILDVKTGSGAFMRNYQDSKALAQSLIAAAAGSGTRVEALITDMDRPLGIAAGNANEIIETIEVLKGKGPADVEEVTRVQAERLLIMSGKYDEKSARKKLDETLRSGAALEQARKWIEAQGGDAKIVDDYKRLPQPSETIEVRAPRSGFITAMDTYQAGMFTVDLGAGRKKADDQIDYAAGVMFDRRTGDEVRVGEPIARIQLGKSKRDAEDLRRRFLAFVTIGDARPEERPLVHELLR